MKEQLINLNNTITNLIKILDCAKDERQLNIYLDQIWKATKEIRDLIGSPNSRKN